MKTKEMKKVMAVLFVGAAVVAWDSMNLNALICERSVIAMTPYFNVTL